MCDERFYADGHIVSYYAIEFEADLYKYGFIAGSLYIFICRKTRSGRFPEKIS